MSTKTSERVALLSIVGFYGIFRYIASLEILSETPSPSLFILCVFFLLLLGWAAFYLPVDRWIYILTLLVPLEFSASLHPLPNLSPIDYVCALSLLGLIFRAPWRSWWVKIQSIFGPHGLMIWGSFFIFGFIDVLVSHGSIRPLLRWMEFLYAYFLAALAFEENSQSPRSLVRLLVWLGAGVSLWACLQFVHSGGDYTKTYAFFNQHNGFGAFLSLCLPVMWGILPRPGSPKRIFYVFAVGVATLAFLLSFSRGAWIGMGFAVLTVLLIQNLNLNRLQNNYRKVFFLMSSGMIILTLWPLATIALRPQLDRSETSSSHIFDLSRRPLYWETALTMTQSHPWLGVGPGNYELTYPLYLSHDAKIFYDWEKIHKSHPDFWQHLHSVYLQILVQYGWIGFLLWAFALSTLVTPSLLSFATDPSFSRLSPYMLISILAFLIHNAVDILFVSSLDLLFAFLLIFSRYT